MTTRWLFGGGPERRRLRARAVVLVLTLAAVSGCRPLYVPLVPDAPQPSATLRLGPDSRLAVVGGRPLLSVSLSAPGAHPGTWLDVQWFGPTGGQAASESQWFEGGASTQVLTFVLPHDVAVRSGEWRAVVSTDGRLLRQFRVDVAVDPEP